ncbi:deoxyribodipyrimidine photolyase [Vibrio ichthyoenteri ATCC 700023]|uniref:Cryptochrome DASH n=1 Tax=Vibrio ichthyoenteri ATCC 700023 TaxID=870968 RepID=F9S6Q7_9VIBR|nr:DASH family cryptochrome [Vibrio ichthyoenteri]EGU32607.1 deoxyribodipyrimidine photolyase [Vibrio ichthyoenteri ATCC 700023]
MKNTIGLYWFTQDLRIDENPLLQRVSQEVETLICLYCVPKMTRFLTHYAQERQFGAAKAQFVAQSVHNLSESLSALRQRLLITTSDPHIALHGLIKRHAVTHLYCDHFVGSDERDVLQRLDEEFPSLIVTQDNMRNLYHEADLPFELEALPATFTQFRKQIEAQQKPSTSTKVTHLPPPLELQFEDTFSALNDDLPVLFPGGEHAGIAHCQRYFSSSLPQHYKQTRNELDGMDYSTKLSPWLAMGCLSPRTVLAMLAEHEGQYGANESTYWIYFELLWREYFYWSALKHGATLFHFSGNKTTAPLTSFYAQRFVQWKRGETPFPIVNACMHQLNQTGYMSNRGRQIVASCLIHELQLDWRYGAAYFETQLVDYDVASNWGNWQYLAGVGADPRGSRRFDLNKQTQQYDANSSFIERWQGRCAHAQVDSVDMVDWPIVTPKGNEEFN